MDHPGGDGASTPGPKIDIEEIARAFPKRFPDFRCSVCETDKFYIGHATIGPDRFAQIAPDMRFPLPPDDVSLRRATSLDVVPIMDLVERAVAETYAHLFDGGQAPKPDPSDPWATAWVAEDRQDIVGVGLAIDDGIDDLWISKSHRGNGVGASILACLETQIAARSYPKARLRVVAGNGAARRFYRRHGWIEGESHPHERWGFEMIDLWKDLTVDGRTRRP